MAKPLILENPGGVIGNQIFEQVESGGISQYVVYAGDSWVAKAMIQQGTVNFMPVTPAPWLPPGKPVDYESNEQIWAEIREFVYEHIDFPFDELYDVFTAWVMSTWRLEQWDSVAYLNFLGTPNSGKTRCLEVLNHLCYRPLAASNISTAAVFRTIEAWRPTFLIDEAQTLRQKEKADIVAILNSGQRRGMKAIRVEKVREGQLVLKVFDTFCFKAMAGTESLARTLTSRSIVFHMTRAVRPVKRFIDKVKAEELRCKLLLYRFKNLFKEIEMTNPFDLPDGRLVELYLPLIEVAPTSKEKEILQQWAVKSYKTILREEKTLPEAKIFEVIVELISELGKTIPLSAITEKLNIGVPEADQWKSNSVSYIIGDKLGFERDRVNVGSKKISCVLIDDVIYGRLKKRYLPDEKIDAYFEESLR